MTEEEVEKDIQNLGLTAPRITPDHINSLILKDEYHIFNKVVTVCCLTLKNGFTVIGESAPVSPANFDMNLGRKIAREKAREKVWELEGYLLKQRIWQEAASGIP